MNNRDVAISACSVLLGALLGVGSILYAAEEVALSAIDPNAIRDGSYRTAAPEEIDGSQYNKRAISRNRVKSSTVVEKKVPVRRAAPVSEEVVEETPVCAEIEDVLSNLRMQVLWLVGDDFEDEVLREGITGSFNASLEENGCSLIEDKSALDANGHSAGPTIRVRVDNDCENFSPRRGAQCKAYERAGIEWEPSQGIDR